ncbi:hypothetical protein EDC01DRAFT_632841 [Geopyxis carbonaria]|nr:hypothetical protein EDC01DRAFT_632841 [Geopyxis carbonaria]
MASTTPSKTPPEDWSADKLLWDWKPDAPTETSLPSCPFDASKDAGKAAILAILHASEARTPHHRRARSVPTVLTVPAAQKHYVHAGTQTLTASQISILSKSRISTPPKSRPSTPPPPPPFIVSRPAPPSTVTPPARRLPIAARTPTSAIARLRKEPHCLCTARRSQPPAIPVPTPSVPAQRGRDLLAARGAGRGSGTGRAGGTGAGAGRGAGRGTGTGAANAAATLGRLQARQAPATTAVATAATETETAEPVMRKGFGQFGAMGDPSLARLRRPQMLVRRWLSVAETGSFGGFSWGCEDLGSRYWRALKGIVYVIAVNTYMFRPAGQVVYLPNWPADMAISALGAPAGRYGNWPVRQDSTGYMMIFNK